MQSVEDQHDSIRETVKRIVEIIESGINVVITHGNGPQVGFILLRSELAKEYLHEIPLPSAGADTQGAIGYQIQQSVSNLFLKKGIKKSVATIITQVLVDQKDPAFLQPSKPIGPFFTKEEAEEKRRLFNWDIIEDAGRGFRRVVASPYPLEIIEEDAIADLIRNNFVVIAVGGGGIPVIRNDKGELKGVAAVIDKDRASRLLANKLNAELFIISTAVENVYLNFGQDDQIALDQITLAEAKKYCQEGHFKKGSMLPKIESAIEFLEAGGKEVIITTPELIAAAVKRKAGTRIVI